MLEATRSSDTRRDAAQLAGGLRRWLASGRIQAAGGAFCAWREGDSDVLAFEYPEITGYALTWLTGREQPTERELRAAAGAANWLQERLDAGDRSARASWDTAAVYNFDLGMIAPGLMTFGELVGDRRALELGRRLASELAAQVEPGIGLGPLAPGTVSSRPDEWSTAGYAHMTKCTQALLIAGEHEAAATLAQAAIDAQRPDGGFVTQPDDEYVMLHPHFYTVEGLWMFGTATEDEAALDAARRATEWAWTHQLPSGGLPRVVAGGDAGPEQLDVTSQAIRAAVLLEVEAPGLDAAVSRLVQCSRADGVSGSALVYSPQSAAIHLNAWVTMFGAQALTLAAEGPQALPWNALV